METVTLDNSEGEISRVPRAVLRNRLLLSEIQVSSASFPGLNALIEVTELVY